MEQKIMEVMRRMQDILSEEQLRELQSALRVTFEGCSVGSGFSEIPSQEIFKRITYKK